MNAKPLFVFLFFILFIILFISQSIGSTDLTPDTPPAYTGRSSSSSSSNTAVQGVYASKCGPSYTVVSGDTLSRIAQACGLTVQEILAQNPSITNPNLIHSGDLLTVYVAPTVLPPATQPPVLSSNNTATQPPVSPSDNTAATNGLRPGGVVVVDIANFPALSNVSVTLGPLGGKMEKVKEVQVDKNGTYKGNIGIPPTAKVGEKWVLISTSVTNPALSVTSPPFEIVK